MKYLIVCGGDRSKHKVALSILKYFINEQKNNIKNIFVCVVDAEKEICDFLKKKKIKFISKNIKNYLINLETYSFDWLLNIWSPLIYKNEILRKFKNNLNLHPSYLPYAKGKDPYVWSIQKQYPLGVTIHEMNSKIDSGKFFVRKKLSLDFPYKGGEVFDRSLKQCIVEFKKHWKNIRNHKISKKKLKRNKVKTFKRADLIFDNFIDLNKKNNSILRKFIYKVLSHDFDFNKLQLKIGKSIYNIRIDLKKSNKKNWYK